MLSGWLGGAKCAVRLFQTLPLVFLAAGLSAAHAGECALKLTEPRVVTPDTNLIATKFDDACRTLALLYGDRLDLLSLQTLKVEASLPRTVTPTAMDFSPDGSRVYLGNSGRNTLSVIDVASLSERRVTIPQQAGKDPDSITGIAAAASGKILVQTQQDSNVGRLLKFDPVQETFRHLLATGSQAWTRRYVDFIVTAGRATIVTETSPGLIYTSSTGEIRQFDPANFRRGVMDPSGPHVILFGNVLNARLERVMTLSNDAPSVLDASGRIAYQRVRDSIDGRQTGFLDVYNPRTGIRIGRLPSEFHNMKLSPDGSLMLTAPFYGVVLTPTAAQSPPLRTLVFSAARPEVQSYIRLHNTGDVDGTISVSLADATTGAVLGEARAHEVPAGAVRQFGIGQLEAFLPAGPKPANYVLSARSTTPMFRGTLQHVVWRPLDQTLTNLSTCSAGVTANPKQLSFVRSSRQDQSYQSTIVLVNAGDSESVSPALSVYSAEDGRKLGEYRSIRISGPGQVTLTADQLEAHAGIVNPAMTHYVVVLEGPHPIFLQHLINNRNAGVIADTTAVCDFSGSALPAMDQGVHPSGGTFYGSQNPQAQSLLRVINNTTTGSPVQITVHGPATNGTGPRLGRWTSPFIPKGAAMEFHISEIESVIPSDVGSFPYYSLKLSAPFPMQLQHVLVHPDRRAAINLSACSGMTADPRVVAGVPTSRAQAVGHGATIVAVNTGTAAAAVKFGVYDGRLGIKLGVYTSEAIASGAGKLLSIVDIESAMALTADYRHFYYTYGDAYHVPDNVDRYVLRVEGTFDGYLQNIVETEGSGVASDMTASCPMVQ